MNQTEFNELHTNCVTALQDYVTSAELTATMLGHCTPDPLPLADRLSLMFQESAEERSRFIYMDVKRILHDAARLGYHYSD
jgi:hypothetical protein